MSRGIRLAFVMGDCIPGGVRSYAFRYARELSGLGYGVDLLCYEGAARGDRGFFRGLGGRLLEYPRPSRPLACLGRLTRLFAEGRYDVAHGLLNTLNPVAMVAAERAGVPVRVAENLSTAHPSERKSGVKLALKPFARVGATHIAANSVLAAEWLYGTSASRCAIIKNPIDLGRYAPDADEREAVRAELGISGGFAVGWVGRYAPQKNPAFLPELAAALRELEPSARVLMVGSGPLEGEVRERIRELGVRDAVIETGSTEDLPRLYRAMDAFALPSLYEGLPVVGIEAQATGLPCLFSDEVTREAAVNPNVGFLPLDAPVSEWARTLLGMRGGLHPDQGLLERAGYGAEAAARKLDEFYRDALERTGVVL